jgi:non-heme chloroperoxidase
MHDRCTNFEEKICLSTTTVKDGTTIYYKDWRSGPVVTFSHGWPLNSDAWEGQLHFLVEKGFWVIAHDRRGYGRSSQAWSGNDMNGYADDLAALIEVPITQRQRSYVEVRIAAYGDGLQQSSPRVRR